MTAFSGVTNFNSPEAVNRRLSNAAFLQTRDLQFYEHMVLEIQRLQHPGENIPIPDPVEMGAWQRAFAVYETLRDRAAAEENRVAPRSQASLDDERAWSEYVENIQAIKTMLQREVFDRDVLTEHLDLQLPGDLASPTTPEPDKYGNNRHPDWHERARRLSSALRWWGALGAEARDAIKTQRALKKLQAFKEARVHG